MSKVKVKRRDPAACDMEGIGRVVSEYRDKYDQTVSNRNVCEKQMGSVAESNKGLSVTAAVDSMGVLLMAADTSGAMFGRFGDAWQCLGTSLDGLGQKVKNQWNSVSDGLGEVQVGLDRMNTAMGWGGIGLLLGMVVMGWV